jgi:outer membrane protein assembly factor BamB
MSDQAQRTVQDLVFVGFNSRVNALDRYTGETVWTWKSPKGSGYAAILVDGDRLIVSVNGYMYCLDPIFGQEVWSNPLPGMGTGVPCLASANGTAPGATGQFAAMAVSAQKAQAAAAATVVT